MMPQRQLLKEIILHMKNYDEIEHFCKSTETIPSLCEDDLDIRDHIQQMKPDVIRMNPMDKQKIKETMKLKLPIEIKKKIIDDLVDQEQLAMECYKDPDFSDICKNYQQSFCKDVLLKANFKKDLDKWKNRHCYLLEEIFKLIRIINRNIEVNLTLANLVPLVCGFRFCLSLTESDFDKIPNEIINFIQKNERGISDKEFSKESLYNATKTGDYKEANKILNDYFVPIEIKNDLLKIAVDQFILQKKRNYGEIIDYLILNGATNIFYLIREAVRTNNIYLIGRYSSEYLIFYTLKECIITENLTLINSLTNSISQDRFPGSESRIVNLRGLINLPELIALIYYHKFNNLLPYFLRIASESDMSKAQIIYLTKYEESF